MRWIYILCKGELESPRDVEWRWKEDYTVGYPLRGPACPPSVHVSPRFMDVCFE